MPNPGITPGSAPAWLARLWAPGAGSLRDAPAPCTARTPQKLPASTDQPARASPALPGQHSLDGGVRAEGTVPKNGAVTARAGPASISKGVSGDSEAAQHPRGSGDAESILQHLLQPAAKGNHRRG